MPTSDQNQKLTQDGSRLCQILNVREARRDVLPPRPRAVAAPSRPRAGARGRMPQAQSGAQRARPRRHGCGRTGRASRPRGCRSRARPPRAAPRGGRRARARGRVRRRRSARLPRHGRARRTRGRAVHGTTPHPKRSPATDGVPMKISRATGGVESPESVAVSPKSSRKFGPAGRNRAAGVNERSSWSASGSRKTRNVVGPRSRSKRRTAPSSPTSVRVKSSSTPATGTSSATPKVRSRSENRSPLPTASEPTAAPATTRSSSSASPSRRSRRASRCSTMNTSRDSRYSPARPMRDGCHTELVTVAPTRGAGRSGRWRHAVSIASGKELR